jgi:hypothetical protein
VRARVCVPRRELADSLYLLSASAINEAFLGFPKPWWPLRKTACGDRRWNARVARCERVAATCESSLEKAKSSVRRAVDDVTSLAKGYSIISGREESPRIRSKAFPWLVRPPISALICAGKKFVKYIFQSIKCGRSEEKMQLQCEDPYLQYVQLKSAIKLSLEAQFR